MKMLKNSVKIIMALSLAVFLLLGSMATAFAAESDVVITFDSKGGTAIANMTGEEGSALYLPRPEREGYIFAGWYNKSGDKLFLDTVFPSANTNLYAKWDVKGIFFGFENTDKYLHSGDASFTARCKLSQDDAATGNTSLYYEHSVIDSATSALASVSVYSELGTTYQFLNDTSYILTFKYKVVGVTKPGAIGVVSSDDLYPWRNRIQQVNNNKGVAYSEEDIGKGWKEGTIKFTTSGMKENSRYFSIAISGCGKLYVDDLLIRIDDKECEYKGNAIEFVSNGGSYVKTIYGNLGDAVTLPEEPEKEGFNFINWYTDVELVNDYQETTINRCYTMLYAEWFKSAQSQKPSTNQNNNQTTDPDVSSPTTTGTSTENNDADAQSFPIDITYIVIGAAGLVVVIVAVVVIVVVSKKKAKKVKTQSADENEQDKEAK